MTSPFFHPDAEREFTNEVTADSELLQDESDQIAHIVYPFVYKRRKALRATCGDVAANKGVLSSILEEIRKNPNALKLARDKAKEVGIQYKIAVDTIQFIRLSITGLKLSEMLESEDTLIESESIIIESTTDSDAPPTRNIGLPDKHKKS